ncbi:MAG: hypothetical protein ACPKPY_08370 [Nitrososphaeraceae archaeon]
MLSDELGTIIIKVSMCEIVEIFYDNEHETNLNILQNCNGPGISIKSNQEDLAIKSNILNNCITNFTNALCSKITPYKVMVHGIDPNPHMFYTSPRGIFVQIEPGSYHITQEGIDDYGVDNIYCNGDIIKLGNYGGSLKNQQLSNYCAEFSHDCSGTIKKGETKICQIINVNLKKIPEISQNF